MTYELWDMQTGNLAGDYSSEAEALAALREIIAVYGRGWVKEWELVRVANDGTPTQLACGDALLAAAVGDGLPSGA